MSAMLMIWCDITVPDITVLLKCLDAFTVDVGCILLLRFRPVEVF